MSFLIGTLSFLMLAISLFMILLVLIQRGRGGGLAGAFGGMGGQSAFGTRAGDTFTRITIVLAVVWVLLAGGLGMIMRRDAEASKTGNKRLDTLRRDRQARRRAMTAEPFEKRRAGAERAVKIERRDRPAGAFPEAVPSRNEDDRPVIALDET